MTLCISMEQKVMSAEMLNLCLCSWSHYCLILFDLALFYGSRLLMCSVSKTHCLIPLISGSDSTSILSSSRAIPQRMCNSCWLLNSYNYYTNNRLLYSSCLQYVQNDLANKGGREAVLNCNTVVSVWSAMNTWKLRMVFSPTVKEVARSSTLRRQNLWKTLLKNYLLENFLGPGT